MAARLAKLEDDRGNRTAAEHALAEAGALYRKADTAAEPQPAASLLWKMHDNSESLLESRGNALRRIAMLAHTIGRTDEAERGYSEALRIATQVPGEAGLAQGISENTLFLLIGYGDLQLDTQRPEPAIATFDRAIAMAGSLLDAMPQNHDVRFGLASALNTKAEALVDLSRDTEAVQVYTEAESVARDFPGPHLLKNGENLMRMIALHALAELKQRNGSASEVARLLDDAAQVGRAYVAGMPKEQPLGAIYLASAVLRQALFANNVDADRARARARLAEARQLIDTTGTLPTDLLRGIEVAYAQTAAALGQFDDADRSFDTALRAASRESSAGHARAGADDDAAIAVLLQWARANREAGRMDAALTRYAEAEARANADLSAGHSGSAPLLTTILFEQITTLSLLGTNEQRPDLNERRLGKATTLETLTRSRPGIPGAANGVNEDRLDALDELGLAYERLGREKESLDTYRSAVTVARAYLAASTQETQRAHFHLAMALTANAQLLVSRNGTEAEAVPLLREAVAQAPRMDLQDRWAAVVASAELANAFDRLGRAPDLDAARSDTLRLARQLPAVDGLAQGENLHTADAYFQLALTAERQGNNALAAEQFSLAAQTMRAVSKKVKPSSFDTVRLTYALYRQARPLQALNRNDEAIRKLEEASEVATSAESIEYLRAAQDIAPALFNLGKPGRAAALLERALDLAETLPGAGTLATGQNVHALGLLVESAKLSEAMSDNASAMRVSRRGADLGESLLALTPDDLRIRRLTTEALIFAADAQVRDGDLHTADSQLRRAVETAQLLSMPASGPDWLQWRAYLRLSDVQFRRRQPRDAQATAAKALKIALLLPDLQGRAKPGVNSEAIETYRALAEMAAAQSDTTSAGAHYASALKVARSLQALYPQASWFADTVADIESAQARLRRGGFGGGQ